MNMSSFTNGEFELRIEAHDVDGFRVQAAGVARALGFASARDLLRVVPAQEQGWETAPTLGGSQQMKYLTQAGFYRVLGQRQVSRITDQTIRAQVDRFQSWVYGIVLPGIHQHGYYSLNPSLAPPQFELPGNFEEALEQLLVTVKQLRIAGTKIEEDQPKVEAFEAFIDTATLLYLKQAAMTLAQEGLISKTSSEQVLRDFLQPSRTAPVPRTGINWIFASRGLWWARPAELRTGRFEYRHHQEYVDRHGKTHQSHVLMMTPTGLVDLRAIRIKMFNRHADNVRAIGSGGTL